LVPRPGNMSQNDPKTTYDVSHEKSTPRNQKTFFECSVEDWPIRLSP